MTSELDELLQAIREQTQALTAGLAAVDSRITESQAAVDSRITESQAAVDSRITESQAAVDSRITESQAEVLSKLIIVEERLERIERNTIVIMGKVISDFDGITPETKESLEAEFTKILENEALLAELRIVSEKAKIQRAAKVTIVNKKLTFNPTLYLNKLNPTATHGDKSAYGNWIGNVMAKAFNQQFYSVYYLELAPVISLLATYYATERISTRLY